MKKNTFVFFLVVSAFVSQAQHTIEPSPIKWYTVEEADSLNKILPKPWMIDVYTDWCGWCTHMMKTTFASPGIAGYINANFYPVRLDAETKDTIVFKGKKFFNVGQTKKSTHQLAQLLLSNRMSYPTLVFFDRTGKSFPVPGYLTGKQLEPLLVYVQEDIGATTSYDDFERYFQASFPQAYAEELKKLPDSLKPDTKSVLQRTKPDSLQIVQNKQARPVILFFYTDWCHSCKVFLDVVVKDSIVADYLNKKTYFSVINAASNENISFFGKTYKSSGAGNPHELTYTFLKGNYKMPSLAFFNSKGELEQIANGFFLPETLESVLVYFVEEHFKKKNFNDFAKSYKPKAHN